MKVFSITLAWIYLTCSPCDAFQSVAVSLYRKPTQVSVSVSPESLQSSFNHDEKSYSRSKHDVKALVRIGKGDGEKIINSFGLWCAIVSIITGPIWMMAMSIVNFVTTRVEDLDPHKSFYDTTGKVWSKVWLSLTNCYPTISGNVELLKNSSGPCLYVANHASWMDIPVLCTVLDTVFKFIAKGELRKVPCIGQQLAGVSTCV
jgi:Acyltransferase